MKSAKALVAAGVAFVAGIVTFMFPELPENLIVMGSVFLSGLLVYFIPNK